MSNWQIYLEWFRKSNIPCPVQPNVLGVFRKGTITAVLPFLRVYWAPSGDKEKSAYLAKSFGIDKWPSLGQGRSRFFRADQLLDWLAAVHQQLEEPTSERGDFTVTVSDNNGILCAG
jgi:hypothetical protein